MARIGRYAGSIIVEHDGKQILVGNPKEPCAVGDTLAPPYTLPLDGKLPLSGCALLVDCGNLPQLARTVAEKLLIARNGSVSERLWRLATSDGAARLQWLVDVPAHVWEIVRDNVLRCS